MSSIADLAGGAPGLDPGDPVAGAVYGRVTRAPASTDDALSVTVDGFSSDHSYTVPAGQWAPRGTHLPAVGTRCLIVLDDRDDAWVPLWVSVIAPDAGPQGPQGVQGTQGPQGVQGHQGVQGTQGSQGAQGLQGYQGTRGFQGDYGGAYTTIIGDGSTTVFTITHGLGTRDVFVNLRENTGTYREVWAGHEAEAISTTQVRVTFTVAPTTNQFRVVVMSGAGPQGVQGTTGTQGLQGSTGTQGTTGAQGSTGAQGTTGSQGTTGTQGPQGFQGTTGAQGTQGVQGATGSQGTQGHQGTQGTQGAQGTQGTSSAARAFRAIRTGSVQSIPSGAGTAINWDGEDFDTHGWFDPATDRFTPLTAGYYHFHLSCFLMSMVAAKQIVALIYKNGTVIKETDTWTGGSGAHAVEADLIVFANGTTDYFTASVFQGDTVARDLYNSAAHTFFEGFLIGS